MNQPVDAQKMTSGKALIALVVIAVCVVIYAALGTALGIKPLYAGYAFAFYFAGLQGGNLSEWPAAVIGSLAGLLVAALQLVLPQHFGTAGTVVGILVIVVTIYGLLMGWVPIVLNNAYVLMLTIGTIPPVLAEADFGRMAGAVLLAAAFLGGLRKLADVVMARRQPAVAGA